MTRFALVALLAVAVPAAADDAPLTRIAFGSCADQDKPCPVWDAVAAQKPDLLVLLGDTIYADLDRSKKVTPELIQSKYEALAAVPGFAKLRESTKLIGTYDDHDYGKNDGDETWPLKDDAQRILLDFYKVPADSPRRTRKGAYHAELYGPPGKRVQVIVLDGRYHRSPGKTGPRRMIPGYGSPIAPYIPDPAANLLGDEQWAWLEEQLKQPAELRLIGTGVQVLSEDHPFEKWANFPKERERLYKLLRETKANGVVVLSGDRHLAELSLDTKAIGYPLYDVTSSGFNQASKSWRAPEPNKHRVAAVPYGDNFGIITIDWASETSPRVSLQLRDEDGEIVVKQNIRLGMLKPNPDAKVAAGRTTEPDPPALPKPDGVLDPADALKKVGETVTVQFAVKSGRAVTKRLLLNSDADFRSDANFTVVLTGKALTEGKFKDATFDTFKGKTVRATGKVTEYQNRPQLQIDDETKIEIVEK
jgi:alkaline phosphatase D